MKETKTTYLINKTQEDGSIGLAVVSSAEWAAIVRLNKQLPTNQRRYFIVDYIVEPHEIDRMVIETSYADYSRWNKEHMKSERNRKLGSKFKHCFLDDIVALENGEVFLLDIIKAENSAEGQLLDQLLIEDLRKRLAAWKPWGNDLLDLYLDGEKRASKMLTEKYGVSAQVVCKYKRQFEAFVKNYLTGVSNETSFCVEKK